VTGSVQTASGKLVFARLEADPEQDAHEPDAALPEAPAQAGATDGPGESMQPAVPAPARGPEHDAPPEATVRPRERGPFGPQRGGEAGPRPTPRNPRRG
jgi:hypothetical protein